MSPLPLDEQINQLKTRGYIVIRNLIPENLIADIKSELEPFLRQQHMGRNDFEGLASERVYALLAKSPSIARLVEHQQVLAIVDQLLPKDYLLSANLAIKLHPGETVQPWHIDDAAGGFPFPLPRPAMGVSTIWALDDFTNENGATQIIPGSHLWSAEHEIDPEDAITITMPAGSVLVFMGNTLHRGGANSSAHTRLAITPQYCAPWMRQIENMVLAIPPDMAHRYSERIQAMLGYSVAGDGFMGYVDGVHPRRLINPDYSGRKDRNAG